MRKGLKKMVIPSAMCVCLLSSFTLAVAEDSKEVTLDGVEVHSTSISEYQVTTEVITAEKIKEMGATNLAEAIDKVPGLYVSYVGKGARVVRIRGASNDQTKIYIDGMPVFPMSGIASNTMSNLSTIPVENIEKIEIIKGPGPVQFGTDYKGGLILITTKTGKGTGQTNLQLSGGSHKSFDNYISYSGSKDNISYYIAAGRQQGDGYLRNTEFDKDYFDGKFKWNLGNNSSLTVSGYYMNTDREIANGIDQATGAETTNSIPWSGDAKVNGKYNTKDWKHKDLQQTNLAVQLDQKISNKFKYNFKVYHVSDDDNLWVYNQNNATQNKNPIWYRSSWYSQGNGMEFTGDLLTARNNTITFGAKYTNIQWHCDENNTDSDEHGVDKRYGYYLQDAVKLGDATNLTIGVRHDQAKQSYHYSKTGSTTLNSSSTVDTTDPVFNITHLLDEKNTLRFSAGKTHNFVTSKQATSNLTAGVPLPDAEKAENYELGWAHNFNDKSSLDVAIFKNKIDNRIDKVTDASSPLYLTYYNVCKTEIKGVEVQYNQDITDCLKGFVNYTYQDSKDTSQTGVKTDSTGLPEQMANYGLTYTVDKFKTTLVGHIVGKVKTESTTYPRLDRYHTVDLDVRYNENKNTEYFLRINNLFNTNYWETYSYPGEGINFMAGVNIKM